MKLLEHIASEIKTCEIVIDYFTGLQKEGPINEEAQKTFEYVKIKLEALKEVPKSGTIDSLERFLDEAHNTSDNIWYEIYDYQKTHQITDEDKRKMEQHQTRALIFSNLREYHNYQP